jgi:hypothetical protein
LTGERIEVRVNDVGSFPSLKKRARGDLHYDTVSEERGNSKLPAKQNVLLD